MRIRPRAPEILPISGFGSQAWLDTTYMLPNTFSDLDSARYVQYFKDSSEDIQAAQNLREAKHRDDATTTQRLTPLTRPSVKEY